MRLSVAVVALVLGFTLAGCFEGPQGRRLLLVVEQIVKSGERRAQSRKGSCHCTKCAA